MVDRALLEAMLSGQQDMPPDAMGGIGMVPDDPFARAALRQSRYVGGRYQEPPPQAPTPSPMAVATSAVDPFGLPSYVTGLVSPEAKEKWRGSYEGDTGQYIGGLAPVPFVGGAASTVAKPIVNFAKSFPKTVGATLGLTSATEAAEGSKQIFERAGEYTPQIEDLKTKIAAQEADLKALGAQKTPEPGQFKSARAQKAAEGRAAASSDRLTRQMESVTSQLEKNRARLGEVQDIQDKISAEGRSKEAAERPLVERAPWTGSLPVVGGVIAATAAYNPRLRAVMAQRALSKDLGDIAPMAEVAAGRTMMTPKGAPQKQSFNPTGGDITAIEQAREMARVAPGMRSAGEGDLLKGLAAAPAGVVAAAEGAMLPYQIDWANAGKDTPAGRAARERFFTGEGWGKTAVASLVGGTGSMVGAKIPTHRAPAATLEGDLARATGAVNAFDIRQAAAAAPTKAVAAPGPRGVTTNSMPVAPAAFSPQAARARQDIEKMSEKDLRIALRRAMMGR
jgi:hypothetical protein